MSRCSSNSICRMIGLAVVFLLLFPVDRAVDVYDVGVDQLVGLQRVLWDGDEV